jgi:hypothetical protein
MSRLPALGTHRLAAGAHAAGDNEGGGGTRRHGTRRAQKRRSAATQLRRGRRGVHAPSGGAGGAHCAVTRLGAAALWCAVVAAAPEARLNAGSGLNVMDMCL